jgi:hypothetical protein
MKRANKPNRIMSLLLTEEEEKNEKNPKEMRAKKRRKQQQPNGIEFRQLGNSHSISLPACLLT